IEAGGERGDLWVQAQLNLADLAWRFGEFGLAEDHFRRASGEGGSDEATKSRALRGLGHLMVMQSRHNEALTFYQEALEQAQQTKDIAGTAKALIGLSRVHLI